MSEIVLRQLARMPGFIGLWTRSQIGSVPRRVKYGAWPRPHYAYGVHAAADQAKRLGIPRISVLELGVAGGNGLLALEAIAKEVAKHFSIGIDVYGFDTGAGMPSPVDFRDVPHVWGEGFYHMDHDALRQRLSTAQLVLGNVRETIPPFVAQLHSPIGFVAFDLDYYSSTKDALALFDGPSSSRIPRVYCYMDDIIWPEYACHNEYVGELRAILEFNGEHESMKLAPVNLLRHMRPRPERWNEQIYVLHDFAHPSYARNITAVDVGDREIPLE